METLTETQEREPIYLERQNPQDFEEKLETLSQKEIRGETEGIREASAIRDRYKEELVQKTIAQGLTLDSIKEMPEEMKAEMDRELSEIDEKFTINGVHFLKCQFSDIIDDLRQGKQVEYEAFGPYLKDYLQYLFDKDTKHIPFTKTDEIGLAIMKFLSKEVMPEGRPVSLYDEYNLGTTASGDSGMPVNIDRQERGLASEMNIKGLERGQREVSPDSSYRKKFQEFVEKVFRENGIIKEGDKEGPENDFVLVSESEKIKDAEKLVDILRSKGLVETGEGEEIWFQNTIDKCENPRYLKINLRDKNGKWQCPALDASSFLKPINREITHLVVLPKENFENQQDQVWEILHTLDFKPDHYHNIFFETEDSDVTPESAVKTLRKKIGSLVQ